ncbi:hypothetical protein BS78_03G165000 [Paspalum vaginatum]|nr:hypothetical protein BS78_03G165000 [Paspalum vaginatum]
MKQSGSGAGGKQARWPQPPSRGRAELRHTLAAPEPRAAATQRAGGAGRRRRAAAEGWRRRAQTAGSRNAEGRRRRARTPGSRGGPKALSADGGQPRRPRAEAEDPRRPDAEAEALGAVARTAGAGEPPRSPAAAPPWMHWRSRERKAGRGGRARGAAAWKVACGCAGSGG